MRPVHELILLMVVLTDFWVLGATRLSSAIRATAVQGLLLAMLPMALHHEFTVHLLALAIGTLAVKAVLLPRLLSGAIRESVERRERPLLGFTLSLLLGAVTVALAFWIGPQLRLPGVRSEVLVPAALATVMIGLIALTTRHQAVSQVVGYLVIENGIYVFGLSQARRVPFIVEVGVLLDVFAGVFIMGIVVFHIHREFASLDSDLLSELTEVRD